MFRALILWAFLAMAAYGAYQPDRGLNVLQYGADPTGATDSSAAFTRAIAAAVANGSNYLIVPPTAGKYLLTSAITIPDNFWLHGEGLPVIDTEVAGLRGILLRTNTKLDGIYFNTTSGTVVNQNIIYSEGFDTSSCEIWNCRFEMHSGAGIQLDQNFRNARIHNNYFHLGSEGCFLIGNLNANVSDNSFLDVARGILCYGGRENLIRGNVINGASVVGVTFLSFRAQGASKNTTFGNIIQGNHIYQTVEEGISLDGHYNDPANWPDNGTNPIITVSSLTTPAPGHNDRIRVNVTEVGQAAAWADFYMAIPVNGNEAGHPFIIEGSGNGFIDVARSDGDINVAAPDKIVIQSGFIHNIIDHNTLERCVTHTGGAGEGAITLWGACWGNIVDHNNIHGAGNHGIVVSSQVDALGSAGNWHAQGWSGYNSITENTISLYRSGSDSSVMGYPIRCYTKQYGTALAAITRHNLCNKIAGNTILSDLGCMVDDCDSTIVEGTWLNKGGSWTFNNCQNCIWGQNWQNGVRYAAPTSTGTTAGTVVLP